MDQSFDVIVIGGGPGGQVAAIRAAQLGLSTACIDDWKNVDGGPALGGTCTNVGCIPAKALLTSSEHFESVGKEFIQHGISAEGVNLDLQKMIARKDRVVRQNNDGILYLFKKNKITHFLGRAKFIRSVGYHYELQVDGQTESTVFARHVVVATGSVPRPFPNIAFDEVQILSNDGALRLNRVPRRLCVIGAGVVGLELGSVWSRLGSEVTLLEASPQLLPSADEQIAKEARKQLEKQGLKFEFGAVVSAVRTREDAVVVDFARPNGDQLTSEFDKLIVSIGRSPNTAGLGCDTVGIERDERGSIVVDEKCRTGLERVWAIGDVVRGPMLAHKAEEEGVAVAERIAGIDAEVNLATVPWVIYTTPEVSWVGRTEQSLKEEGYAYKAGTFPFMANGRARAMGAVTGFAKVLVDAKSDAILGVHIIGPQASELIAEAALAMEFRASGEDIGMTCHAHPTLAETLKEAALATQGRALHI